MARRGFQIRSGMISGTVDLRSSVVIVGPVSWTIIIRSMVRAGRWSVPWTLMIRSVMRLHRRTGYGTAMIRTHIMAVIIRSRSPAWDVIVRTDQGDGIYGGTVRIISVNGSAAVIPVDGVAGAVISVGDTAAAPATVGASDAEAVIIRIITTG